MNDFYFFFSKQEIHNSGFESNLTGSTVFGSWLFEFQNKTELKIGNKTIFKVGIASDRSSSQYEISITSNSIDISAERFGLSPIFYLAMGEVIHISSRIEIITTKIKDKNTLHIDKRFILEQNLFNYCLFDKTIYEEIKLLPANAKIRITERVLIENSFYIEDYFKTNPIPLRKSINRIVDLFIDLNNHKIQNNDYISFTSGFDGRALLALALNQNKKVNTYSFGTSNNPDVTIPMYQSFLLNVTYYPILLDSAEYVNHFSSFGHQILKYTSSNSNLLQLHWPHAAQILSKRTNTIVTGIFGSELFRAANTIGQFTSPMLIDFFANIENDSWINKLKESFTLNFLNKTTFKTEIDSIINDLIKYKKDVLQLSNSQRYYKFIFDEIFRKFFGMQLIQPMRSYVTIINPYIDWNFIKELLSTELAGVNNTFFTHNPIKRFKGQLFYAELIRKTSPELYALQTGKGYSPKNLQSKIGILEIMSSFIRKRLHRNIYSLDLDNLGIISCFRLHKNDIISKGIYNKYYNMPFIKDIINSNKWIKNEIIRDKLIETLSSNLFLIDALK